MILPHTVKGFSVKERILLRYFSVPASLQTCVRNRGTAWIHTIDALQAWHLWDQNCLQNSSCWSYSSWRVRACAISLDQTRCLQILLQLLFYRTVHNLACPSLFSILQQNPRANWDPSKHKILQNDQQRKLDEEGRNNNIYNMPKILRTINYLNMYQ